MRQRLQRYPLFVEAGKLLKLTREIVRELSPAPRGPVFVNEWGRPRQFSQKHWDRAKEKAGIEDVHVHDLRHTAATRLADSGVDAFTISELLGHSSVQMAARYAHSAGEALRQAVEMLGNYSLRHGQGTGDRTGVPEEGVTLACVIAWEGLGDSAELVPARQEEDAPFYGRADSRCHDGLYSRA